MLIFSLVTLGLIHASFSLPSDKHGTEIQWIDCASNVPATLKNGTVQLPSTLPSTLKCGRLDVPMDYSKPMGDDNKITLGFSMHRPNNSQGLINFNPGGPGEEVSSTAWLIALNTTTGATVFRDLEDFDFLAMDTRGTHSSTAVNCTLGDYVTPSGYPSNETEFQAFQGAISTVAQSCVRQSSPKGIMSYLSTNETIQDWDRVRQALGYDTMHFWGISYGTYSGAAYAAMFPEHAGRVVIDAILPHGINNTALMTFQAKSLTRLLLRADAYCLNDTTCPFHSQGKGAVIQAFSNILNLSSTNNGTNPTISDVRTMAVSAYLVGYSNFPGFNEALFDATNGNWSGFKYTGEAKSFDVGLVPVLQTWCLDMHIDDNTFEGFSRIRQVAEQEDPYQIQYVPDLVILALCGGWTKTADYNAPLPINKSIMLVTSDFDASTPTESSTFEFEQTPNSVLVVRHGDDHGSLMDPGPTSSTVIQFLKTGNFPNATNQTFITVYPPGSQRDPIPDPYSVPVGPEAGDFFR